MATEEKQRIVDHDDGDECCAICSALGIEQVVLIEELERRGIAVPAPDTVSKDELPKVIERIAGELAGLRVFLEHTDHLNDEDLYRRLYLETLQEWSWTSPDDQMGATHVDFVGSGSDEDHLLWLTYYADDQDRAAALEWEPALRLPDRKTPPFDRSAILPPATYGPESEDA